MALPDTSSLAVVGSRKVDDFLADYAYSVGKLAAISGRTVVSGGAKGVDSAAMDGALAAGGVGCGVLAENLDKAVLNRKYRDALVQGRLTLISPYDPSSIFSVGHALGRNKYIYALSDAALVVNSDLEKGGTWAGAVEQIDKLNYVPVYVRSTGPSLAALNVLIGRGAMPWPHPMDDAQFDQIFNVDTKNTGLINSLLNAKDLVETSQKEESLSHHLVGTENESLSVDSSEVGIAADNKAISNSAIVNVITAKESGEVNAADAIPAILFAVVTKLILQILSRPKNVSEIAAELEVSIKQTQGWLDQLVIQDVIEKQKKPVLYSTKSSGLFK